MKIQIDNITLSPDWKEDEIHRILSERYHITDLQEFRIIKKSLDARDKGNIHYRYRIVVDISDNQALTLLQYKEVTPYEEHPSSVPAIHKPGGPVIIVGSGPAGLFCALRLVEAGIKVTILERGKPIDERMKDISLLEKSGALNGESNVLFGEGGAGTYSDGKLTARTRLPESHWFFRQMIHHGAPESILYEARPHIGTDRLRAIIKDIRNTIISSGSDILFKERVSDLMVSRSSVAGVRSSNGKEFSGAAVVLATGHSARDMYGLLHEQNITLGKKGFAIGVRIEHPAQLINDIQYGNSRFKNILPAAEYLLTFNNKQTGRGTYSFCMCPGGQVVNASSEQEMLCLNGMSNSRRNAPFSNAALVVTVHPHDLAEDIMSGIDFQRQIEKAAYISGGGNFIAPAQRVTSFLADRSDTGLPGVSYKPGVRASSISSYLPKWIMEELRAALPVFNRKMKGFISEEAVLMGAETRTSSPLRIVRDDNFQSVSVKGLYPAGEGAGYAGGIVSSAVDGIRVADAIIAGL
ncbi:MAG: hypothetical protein CVV44_00090 [Spirochaetae bacterium HGW-Spirochaetae-1]|jgi:hypothetical protein|nr:MAG: hypothetical protein CVV44_00090 [Spirochaetae bacterium HGW-Spirochaetae-1]